MLGLGVLDLLSGVEITLGVEGKCGLCVEVSIDPVLIPSKFQ